MHSFYLVVCVCVRFFSIVGRVWKLRVEHTDEIQGLDVSVCGDWMDSLDTEAIVLHKETLKAAEKIKKKATQK
jgi:phosphopantetheine adenylyltransferase